MSFPNTLTTFFEVELMLGCTLSLTSEVICFPFSLTSEVICFPFFVWESQKIDATAEPIIIQVTILSSLLAPDVSFFLQNIDYFIKK